MPDRPLIVASNRGPVGWRRGEDGSWEANKGAGGLIVALGDALQTRPGTWVSVALDDNDTAIMAERGPGAFEADTGQGRFTLRLVDAGEAYGPYYNEVANRLLWFTLHQLWSDPYTPVGHGWKTSFADYQAVNERVAQAVIDEAQGMEDPEIHLQDYHLLTAAPHIRAALPDARILLYVHTPWVSPTYFRRLPDAIVAGIMEGLSACDMVGISAGEWARMLIACMIDLGGCQMEGESAEGTFLRTDRGRTLVSHFTLGIDAESLARVAGSHITMAERATLADQVGERRLIVRADRTDLSKNILRGLVAYRLVLQRRPDLVDDVHFRVLLSPSRQGVVEYREYYQACLLEAEEIRSTFGKGVLRIQTSQNFPRVVACMQSYDVLLTNPVIDGTNLVAKEGPALNERDGVLVLSKHAGAAETMTDALLVNPFDVEETADAIEQALDMPAEERARRATALKAAASAGTPSEWLDAQRAALDQAVARRA